MYSVLLETQTKALWGPASWSLYLLTLLSLKETKRSKRPSGRWADRQPVSSVQPAHAEILPTGELVQLRGSA